MKYLIIFFLVGPSVVLAKSSKCEISPEKIFHQVLMNVEAKAEDGLFLEQERLLRALMGDQSDKGTDYIARLSQIYLGESVGEVLSEIVTARGSIIVPLLKEDRCKASIDLHCKTRPDKSACSNSLRCVENSERVARLINLINEKKRFQSDARPLIPLSDKELYALKKDLK